MTDNSRNTDWGSLVRRQFPPPAPSLHPSVREGQSYFESYYLTQMEKLGCAVQMELGVTTAEEFVAWFDAFKGITSQFPGRHLHETHSDDGGLSLCVRSVQPEQVADGAEDQVLD